MNKSKKKYFKILSRMFEREKTSWCHFATLFWRTFKHLQYIFEALQVDLRNSWNVVRRTGATHDLTSSSLNVHVSLPRLLQIFNECVYQKQSGFLIQRSTRGRSSPRTYTIHVSQSEAESDGSNENNSWIYNNPRVRHVDLPCFHRSQEWTNQTPALETAFCVFSSHHKRF